MLADRSPTQLSPLRLLALLALPMAGLAALEVLALAPLSDWRDPRVWYLQAIDTALIVLPAWLISIPLVALLRRVEARQRRPLAAEVPLVMVAALVGLAHLWDPLKDVSGALSLHGIAARAVALMTFLLAVLAFEYVSQRFQLSTGRRLLLLTVILAAAVGGTAARRALDESGAGASRHMLVWGFVLAYLLSACGAVVASRRWGGPAAAVVMLVSLAVLRSTTTNPHEVHRSGSPPAAAAAGPPILLIVLDTFRADALDLSDPASSRTPNLARLARGADVFTDAVANASWTLPGHTSLFTGHRLSEHHTDLTSAPGFGPRVPDKILMTQEYLAARGYRTSAVVGNPIVGPSSRLSRGFQRYVNPGRGWMLATVPIRLAHILSPGTRPEVEAQITTEISGLKRHASAREIVDLALGEVTESPAPLYLCLNFMDVHKPILPTEDVPLATRIAFVRDQALVLLGLDSEQGFEYQFLSVWRRYYNGQARHLDAELGRLFDELRRRGWWDRMAVVVTADHGEAFLENPEVRNYYGHHGAYEPVVRIPLIVKRPGQKAGAVFDRRVQQADLLPTMLSMAGLPPVPGLDGGLDDDKQDTPVVTEWYPRPYEAGGGAEPRWLPVRRVGIYSGDYKFVIEGKDRERLFDLRESPYEAVDVIEREPNLAGKLREELLALLQRSPQQGGSNARPDREMEEQLRALGYVH